MSRRLNAARRSASRAACDVLVSRGVMLIHFSRSIKGSWGVGVGGGVVVVIVRSRCVIATGLTVTSAVRMIAPERRLQITIAGKPSRRGFTSVDMMSAMNAARCARSALGIVTRIVRSSTTSATGGSASPGLARCWSLIVLTICVALGQPAKCGWMIISKTSFTSGIRMSRTIRAPSRTFPTVGVVASTSIAPSASAKCSSPTYGPINGHRLSLPPFRLLQLLIATTSASSVSSASAPVAGTTTVTDTTATFLTPCNSLSAPGSLPLFRSHCASGRAIDSSFPLSPVPGRPITSPSPRSTLSPCPFSRVNSCTVVAEVGAISSSDASAAASTASRAIAPANRARTTRAIAPIRRAESEQH